MKYTALISIFSIILAAALTGCAHRATEAEKEAFNRGTYNNENVQEQEEFDDAIEPGYQNQGVGQTPGWEMPAD